MEEKFSVEITPEGREMLKRAKGKPWDWMKKEDDGTGPSERVPYFLALFSYLLIFAHPTLKCTDISDLYHGVRLEDHRPGAFYADRTLDFYVLNKVGTFNARYYHPTDKKWISYKYSTGLNWALLKKSPREFYEGFMDFVSTTLYGDDALAANHESLSKHALTSLSGGPSVEIELDSLSWSTDMKLREVELRKEVTLLESPLVIKASDYGTLSFDVDTETTKDLLEEFQKDL